MEAVCWASERRGNQSASCLYDSFERLHHYYTIATDDLHINRKTFRVKREAC